MLTPEYLQSVPDTMVELYAQAEADILADMARRINGFDMFIPSAKYQMEMLEEMGELRSDIVKQLSRLTGKSQKELTAIMRAAGVKTLEADEAVYSAAGLSSSPAAASPAVQEVLAAGLKKTSGLFENLTKTTARTASQQFERALDRAYMQVSSGAIDPVTATKNAIKQLAKAGVDAVTYPSGHTDSLEVAVRRAVITGVNQTCGKMQEIRADEMGVDLMELTAHAGARPSHAAWQGQIVSRSGRKGYLSLSDIGYGTGSGFKGWNCSHDWAPYIEGMPRTYSQELLDSYSAKDYEYNGQKMTEYEALQTQRGIERNLRRWKRENMAMKAAGLDISESAAKIAKWQAAQKDFIRQTGLKRQAEREQVAGWDRHWAGKATATATKVKTQANLHFPGLKPSDAMAAYLQDKAVIDTLEANGIKYKQRISPTEIIVNAGKPKISKMTSHAEKNLAEKPDRAKMTQEKAQAFVDAAKLTLYQNDRGTLKFLSQDGYALLSLEHRLVTAVPQKWRKRYDKFLKEE